MQWAPTRVIEVGMPSLDLAEGGANAVPRDRLEVLHEAPPGPVGDRVEADGANAQVGEEGGAFRPRRVVQHRDQDGSGAEPPSSSCSGHRRTTTTSWSRQSRTNRPGRDPIHRGRRPSGRPRRGRSLLQHDLAGAEAIQMRDQIRQEVASLSLLLVHPRQSDGRCHRLRTLRSRSARHSGRRTQSCEADRGRSMTQAGHRPGGCPTLLWSIGEQEGRVVRCRRFHHAALLARRRDHVLTSRDPVRPAIGIHHR